MGFKKNSNFLSFDQWYHTSFYFSIEVFLYVLYVFLVILCFVFFLVILWNIFLFNFTSCRSYRFMGHSFLVFFFSIPYKFFFFWLGTRYFRRYVVAILYTREGYLIMTCLLLQWMAVFFLVKSAFLQPSTVLNLWCCVSRW